MAKLREIRQDQGLTQAQVADIIKVAVPTISTYESGIAQPDLEDMVILERHFGQRIEWQETYSPRRKHEIIQAIIELAEHFPVEAVCEFANRAFRKQVNPDKFIEHYSRAINVNRIEPLYPPDFSSK